MRDMRKEIERYDAMCDPRTVKHIIHTGEIMQLEELSGGWGRSSLFTLAHNAMRAGYSIGYRCGKRDAKARKRETPQRRRGGSDLHD